MRQSQLSISGAVIVGMIHDLWWWLGIGSKWSEKIFALALIIIVGRRVTRGYYTYDYFWFGKDSNEGTISILQLYVYVQIRNKYFPNLFFVLEILSLRVQLRSEFLCGF